MKVIQDKNGTVMIEGDPEEIVLYSKLSEEWDLYFQEARMRGMNLRDMLKKNNGRSATDLFNYILGVGKSKPDEEKGSE